MVSETVLSSVCLEAMMCQSLARGEQDTMIPVLRDLKL